MSQVRGLSFLDLCLLRSFVSFTGGDVVADSGVVRATGFSYRGS